MPPEASKIMSRILFPITRADLQSNFSGLGIPPVLEVVVCASGLRIADGKADCAPNSFNRMSAVPISSLPISEAMLLKTAISRCPPLRFIPIFSSMASTLSTRFFWTINANFNMLTASNFRAACVTTFQISSTERLSLSAASFALAFSNETSTCCNTVSLRRMPK